MTRLGQLERAVMEALWDKSASSPSSTFTAREVARTLPDHAYTTVLTVLDRLTTAESDGRLRRDAAEAALRIRIAAKTPPELVRLREEVDRLRDDLNRLRDRDQPAAQQA